MAIVRISHAVKREPSQQQDVNEVWDVLIEQLEQVKRRHKAEQFRVVARQKCLGAHQTLRSVQVSRNAIAKLKSHFTLQHPKIHLSQHNYHSTLAALICIYIVLCGNFSAFTFHLRA